METLGAQMQVLSPTKARVFGPTRLHGGDVTALDIRSGSALVLAGLAAEGQTTVSAVHHLRRGYERFIEKLAGLGADHHLRRNLPPPSHRCGLTENES